MDSSNLVGYNVVLPCIGKGDGQRMRTPLTNSNRRAIVKYLLIFGVIWFGVVLSPLFWKSNTYQLDKPVHVVSPDGKAYFNARVDGTMQLVDARTKRVIQQQKIKPFDYYAVDARWISRDEVQITTLLRFAALSKGESFSWTKH